MTATVICNFLLRRYLAHREESKVDVMIPCVASCVLFLAFCAAAAAAAPAPAPPQLGAQQQQQPGCIKKFSVFVTDGRDVALTGSCVFFTRANTSKAITSENVHRVSQFSTVFEKLMGDFERSAAVQLLCTKRPILTIVAPLCPLGHKTRDSR